MNTRKVEWAKDREFVEGSVVVTVWKLPLRRPQYRLDIGCRGRDDRVFRGFLFKFSGKGRLVMHEDCPEDTIAKLVTEAKEYIYGEAQSLEDMKIGRMIDYEERDLSKGKLKQPPGLKKLGKIYDNKPRAAEPDATHADE